MVINGKKIAQEILERLKKKPTPQKYLAAVLVDENSASKSFVTQKEKTARELNIEFKIFRDHKDIAHLAKDEKCGGIILQLPLPPELNRGELIAPIPPEKDVDNLTGHAPVLAPAIGVLEEILLASGPDLIEDSRLRRSYTLVARTVAVVGAKGFLVGAPISKWLEGNVKELILIDINDDLTQIKNADIVITGVGKAGLITPGMLKDGALVIDFGYDSGKGDFDPSSLFASGPDLIEDSQLRRSYTPDTFLYTPTPGGTGPILVAKLFENFYRIQK